MTPEEVVTYAVARLAEMGINAAGARSVLYRQVGIRQQQLYALAAQASPDWAGICATAALVDGAADLSDLVPPLSAAERIQRIEIEDAGTSTYASGDEVHPVPLNDPESELAPRVTVRNRVIRAVGTELDGVASIRVSYARLPAAIAPTDGDTALDMPEPHTELLVVDLARYIARRAPGVAAADRQAAVELLTTEEEPLLAAFLAHAKAYVGSLRARFG